MRDIYTRVNNLRRQVFSAVANLAYEDRDLSEIVEKEFVQHLDWTSSRQESTYQSQQVLTK